MLAWVVYKLSKNTDVLATFETQPEQQLSFVSEDPFDNSAFVLLYDKLRISYRSSMMNSFHSDVIVEVLDESSIDMNLRKSLDIERLMDPKDSYRTLLGLPEDRQARRSYNV
jgi:hypothetical protein